MQEDSSVFTPLFKLMLGVVWVKLNLYEISINFGSILFGTYLVHYWNNRPSLTQEFKVWYAPVRDTDCLNLAYWALAIYDDQRNETYLIYTLPPSVSMCPVGPKTCLLNDSRLRWWEKVRMSRLAQFGYSNFTLITE